MTGNGKHCLVQLFVFKFSQSQTWIHRCVAECVTSFFYCWYYALGIMANCCSPTSRPICCWLKLLMATLLYFWFYITSKCLTVSLEMKFRCGQEWLYFLTVTSLSSNQKLPELLNFLRVSGLVGRGPSSTQEGCFFPLLYYHG
jgi:hypothetical protein